MYYMHISINLCCVMLSGAMMTLHNTSHLITLIKHHPNKILDYDERSKMMLTIH